MRILITGSRDWPFERQLCNTLNEYRDKTIKGLGERHILVSGACPTGADAMAEAYAKDVGWIVERYPANWSTYGKRAGFIRNAEMVEMGADLCIAFIYNQSKGATMTAKLAERAGIPTRIIQSNTSVFQPAPIHRTGL